MERKMINEGVKVSEEQFKKLIGISIFFFLFSES